MQSGRKESLLQFVISSQKRSLNRKAYVQSARSLESLFSITVASRKVCEEPSVMLATEGSVSSTTMPWFFEQRLGI